MIAGREFTWTDIYGTQASAMVSENLARELWGTPAAAVGKRIREFAPVAGSGWRGGRMFERTEFDAKAPATVYWPDNAGRSIWAWTLDVARR